MLANVKPNVKFQNWILNQSLTIMKIKFSKQHLNGLVSLPSSKSIANRILIIQAISNVRFTITNKSSSNDSLVLEQLLNIRKNSNELITLDAKDAGTPFRFLTAFLAMQEGKTTILTGDSRMLQRPIGDLVEALKSIGGDISYLEADGFPPLKIHGKKINGGNVTINTKTSSQFVSALCLIAPSLKEGLKIKLNQEAVSASYIQMTLDLMQQFAIQYTYHNSEIVIPSQDYVCPSNYFIESDWSSASFFYAMAFFLDDVNLNIEGLILASIQGDSFIQNFCGQFGIQTLEKKDGIQIQKSEILKSHATQFDMSSYPDMCVPLIVACSIFFPAISLIGLEHLAHKESNRIEALQTELSKIGIQLIYENGILSFDNTSLLKPKNVEFNTYNDHRIAMSLAMIALLGIEVHLDNSDCVKKSFPEYWNQIAKIGFSIEES